MINPRWAIRAQFAMSAMLLGLWAVRIAEFRVAMGITHSQLGLLMLIAPAALIITMMQIPKITRKLGIRSLVLAGLFFWAMAFLGASLIPPIWMAVFLLLVVGAGAALMEVGLNAIAQKIDRDDRPIMLSAHGFWSIGFMLGSVIGGWLAEQGVSFFAQQMIMTPVVLLVAWACFSPLPMPKPSNAEHSHALPRLSLLPLCMIPFAALFVEGAIADWVSVFLSEERSASPLQYGVIGGLFMAGMALTRLSGDYFRGYFSAAKLIIFSTITASFGLVLFTFPYALSLIAFGAVLTGMGVGIIYPLTILYANEGREEEEAAEMIASIASVSFVAFLVAPPFMGFVAEFYSLELAFAMLIPALMMTLIWLRLSNRV